MGAGTNVQSRLVAVHHLDVGWKPSDMTQRNGRIIRQGNMNKEVKVFNYVTEGTFDAYLWQTLENKQRFIEKSTEECGAVLHRGKRHQGKIADSLNRKHRGFFPFGGESSVFFFVIEAFGTNAQPASGGCSTQRVWDYPNKHFATQKWRLYIRTPCLLQQCVLFVRSLKFLDWRKTPC